MAQATWHALQCEGIRWRRAKDPARAIECLTQAIEITQRSPELSRETGTLLNYLADSYLQQGLLPQAELAIRRAIENRRLLPTSEPTLCANDLTILGEVLSKQGKHQEALQAGIQGLALFRQQYGVDDDFVRRIEEMVKQLGRNGAQAEASKKDGAGLAFARDDGIVS
jgi:tetratricopeptide (TPR) repeat protein